VECGGLGSWVSIVSVGVFQSRGRWEGGVWARGLAVVPGLRVCKFFFWARGLAFVPRIQGWRYSIQESGEGYGSGLRDYNLLLETEGWRFPIQEPGEG